jgi:hypothetical protein
MDWADVTDSILADVAPAVVGIGGGEGKGTGLVVAKDVIVVHSHHFLGAGESPVGGIVGRQAQAAFMDGRTATGAIVADDGDFALLSADTSAIAPPPWSQSLAHLKVGMEICAVGRAPGGGPRLTFGRISVLGCPYRRPLGRLIPNGIEHTAPLGRNAFGSPIIVDKAGRLIGLNGHRRDDGIFNVATPADAELARRIAEMTGNARARIEKLG